MGDILQGKVNLSHRDEDDGINMVRNVYVWMGDILQGKVNLSHRDEDDGINMVRNVYVWRWGTYYP